MLTATGRIAVKFSIQVMFSSESEETILPPGLRRGRAGGRWHYALAQQGQCVPRERSDN